MLSDARSIWSSLSTAASTINDNINTALVNLEQEKAGTEPADHTNEELTIYKKLLDDAQMHHVEL